MSEIVSAPKKRGRPKGSKNKQPAPVALAPVVSDSTNELLMQMLKQQQEMMNRTIQLAEGNQQMMRDWFSLFRPPSGPNTTSTLEQRERMLAGEDDEWVPMRPHNIEEVLKLFNAEDQEYRERMINS
jgi:hypothetical protein